MKRSKKSVLTGMLLASTLVLAACGATSDKSSDTSKEKTGGKVTVWVDSDYVKAYQETATEFMKANKGVEVTVKEGSSVDIKSDITKDAGAVADVFMFPHDQVGQLAEAKALLEYGGQYAKDMESSNAPSAVNAAKYGNKVYAFPYGVEAQVLYYNKATLTADEVTSWDKLTSKGKLGANFAEAGANYVYAPLFISNGDELFGASGEEANGTNFNNEQGVQVLEWIAKQKSNSGVIQSNAATLDNLKSGKIDAFLSGPWSSNDAKAALGENYAVAVYPKIDFGNGEKQMKAFLGVKLFGINAGTKNPEGAVKVAAYFSSKEQQIKNFEKFGLVPSNIEAQENETVKSDPLATTVQAMSGADYSVLMPKSPNMAAFWTAMDPLINDTYKGKITKDQMLPKLTAFVEQLSKG